MARNAYPPLGALKPVTDDVWIVDGPVIRFGPNWLKMPFPTRTTVLRLDGGLMIHSPTALTPSLASQIEALGPPRWIVGPNRIHHWWLPDWHAAYPEAAVYLAPRIKEQAGDRISFPFLPLDRATGHPWDDSVATLPIAGRYMTEVEFFHRPSRTLVLTDLIENFEPSRLSWPMRVLTRLGGAQHPHGSMPRDMRLSFPHDALKSAVETMIGWRPERIILAHGRWYERDGTNELRRAFGWLLG